MYIYIYMYVSIYISGAGGVAECGAMGANTPALRTSCSLYLCPKKQKRKKSNKVYLNGMNIFS